MRSRRDSVRSQGPSHGCSFTRAEQVDGLPHGFLSAGTVVVDSVFLDRDLVGLGRRVVGERVGNHGLGERGATGGACLRRQAIGRGASSRVCAIARASRSVETLGTCTSPTAS